LPPGCGNGQLTADEECDDGNLRSHDGCSSGCTIETLDWAELTPPIAPPLRADHALAYNRARDRVVAFGGYRQGALADTWELDGKSWAQVLPTVSPGPRYSHAQSFDSTAGQVVLFGGSTSGLGGLADTWTYSAATWAPNLAPGPLTARQRHAMAFDSTRGRVVLFGGSNLGTTLGDTWEYVSSAWVNANPLGSPPPARFGHAMAYHPGIARVVLFGGYDDAGNVKYADTWEYDGTSWAPITTQDSPPHRRFHSMVYEEARGVVVLFGGYDGSEPLTDTWEYASGNWQQVTTVQAPRGGPLAYDSRRRRIVLSDVSEGGPTNGTWEYRYRGDWPDEVCTEGVDEDGDGLTDCADPDCDELPCAGGFCTSGTCQ
jgi:cysteine-rich repeat protein